MKPLTDLLRLLTRSDVTELAISSGRYACVRVGDVFHKADHAIPQSPEILQLLTAMGGSIYFDQMSSSVAQWMVRAEGIGDIAVTAQQKGDIVSTRFVLAARATATSSASPTPTQTATPTLKQVPTPDLATTPTPAATTQTSIPTPTPTPPAETSATTQTSIPTPTPTPLATTPAVTQTSIPTPTPTPLPTTPAATQKRDSTAAAAAPVNGSRSRTTLPASGLQAQKTADTDSHGETALSDWEEVPIAADTAVPAEPPKSDVLWSQKPTGIQTRTLTKLESWAKVQDLLKEARASKASDLHIVPGRRALFRIAGELIPRGKPLEAAFVNEVTSDLVPERLKDVMSAEGSCDFAFQDKQLGRFRVNVSNQRTGLKACFRLIPPGVPSLSSLGLPEDISKATHHHQGLIIVTGPSGHGKTSTLAAIVDIINRETTHHVITVEDPIEFIHPRQKAMMSQREVGTHTKSFAAALKASLREDPDVIVIGELRDLETVRVAISASETGHLLIGTMNSPSAAKTIERLIDMFPAADQPQVRLSLAIGLRLIVSQRLLPTADRTGVLAAAELLPGSPQLGNLIRDNKTYQIPSLQQSGKALGIIRLTDSLAELVKQGKTTLEIAKEYAEFSDELEAAVTGNRAAPPEVAETKLLTKVGSFIGRKGA